MRSPYPSASAYEVYSYYHILVCIEMASTAATSAQRLLRRANGGVSLQLGPHLRKTATAAALL